jgi:hypothetical protein
VRWYVRLRAASGDSFPLLATIVLAVFAVGLSVVAFAGLTQLLLADGVIAGAATPSLLDVEKGYLWQLVASIPLLAIPQRFGWIDPLSLTGPVAGTMLLLFKVALIAPLERV